jgi:hypothetical protein
MLAAEVILLLVALYSSAGFLFAIAFITVGVGQIDPAARGTSLVFRLLILPGSMALWPCLLRAWLRARSASKGILL